MNLTENQKLTERKLEEVRLVLDHIQKKNLDKVTRVREIVEPRFYMCLYLYSVLGLTHAEVGAVFKKDYCSSIHGCKVAKKYLEDKDLQFIKNCKEEINLFPLDKFDNVKNELGYIIKEVIIDPAAYTKLQLYKAARSLKSDDDAINMILKGLNI